MEEGLIFYWCTWAAWIWTTFMMDKKNAGRLKYSVMLLLLIILSPYTAGIHGIQVHMSALVLIVFIQLETFRLKRSETLYIAISALIVMLAHVNFLLFELFDPVWVIFKREWMAGICMSALTIILQSSRQLRLVTLSAGLLQGEILFAIIIRKFGFPHPIASPAFLDAACIAAVIIIAWSGMEQFSASFSKMDQVEREKQRSS
ncbi:YphA family membrane protein [Bacillus sp. T33-2]|uniref:YphA family membrane protein n=1 Tax=Bacillus sp. T33-2 TaxID=2054168 RepID=UPI000C7764FB|nr:hypothetical protein [Bacillus sp. T33-2]PLR99759.1 hypothetical protein CVD19_01495 [Bacillus sp. T33-2]